jgi:hypothetical protein
LRRPPCKSKVVKNITSMNVAPSRSQQIDTSKTNLINLVNTSERDLSLICVILPGFVLLFIYIRVFSFPSQLHEYR